MDDRVAVATAARAIGINMTSLTNACVSGRLDYELAPNGQMLVSLSAARSLAAAAGY